MTQIRQELWTMQANLETLRTCIGEVAGLCDVHGLHEGQHVLATRMNEVEKNASLCITCEDSCIASCLSSHVLVALVE